MFRVFESGSNNLLQEFDKLEKAKRYAELYKINFDKTCTIQECKVVWTNK